MIILIQKSEYNVTMMILHQYHAIRSCALYNYAIKKTHVSIPQLIRNYELASKFQLLCKVCVFTINIVFILFTGFQYIVTKVPYIFPKELIASFR